MRNLVHEALVASSRRVLKHTARSARRLFKNVHLSAASPIYTHIDHFSTKRRELRHEEFWNIQHAARRHLIQKVHLRAASPIYIHIVKFSTKRRELRHEDFWNTRHTAPRRLFQIVPLERCILNIHPCNPFLHEATGASSRRLLKHTAHSAAPSVSNCASWALRP